MLYACFKFEVCFDGGLLFCSLFSLSLLPPLSLCALLPLTVPFLLIPVPLSRPSLFYSFLTFLLPFPTLTPRYPTTPLTFSLLTLPVSLPLSLLRLPSSLPSCPTHFSTSQPPFLPFLPPCSLTSYVTLPLLPFSSMQFQERHLQEVILAQQTNSVKKKHVYIPTPDAAITVATYEETAKPIHRASQYVRVPGEFQVIIYIYIYTFIAVLLRVWGLL